MLNFTNSREDNQMRGFYFFILCLAGAFLLWNAPKSWQEDSIASSRNAQAFEGMLGYGTTYPVLPSVEGEDALEPVSSEESESAVEIDDRAPASYRITSGKGRRRRPKRERVHFIKELIMECLAERQSEPKEVEEFLRPAGDAAMVRLLPLVMDRAGRYMAISHLYRCVWAKLLVVELF